MQDKVSYSNRILDKTRPVIHRNLNADFAAGSIHAVTVPVLGAAKKKD